MGHPQGTDLQQQIDDLVALVTKGRTDIDALVMRAEHFEARADAVAESVSVNRGDIDLNRADIDELQGLVAIDRELIAELQADGVVGREHTAQLQKALATSRTIGAAVGVLMASRNVDQDEALRVLKEASSRANTPMRHLAELIVSGSQASVG